MSHRKKERERINLHPESAINLPLADLLVESANKPNEDTELLPNGVLLARTGEFTGRSHKDKYLVKNGATGIDWGINKSVSPSEHAEIRRQVQEFSQSHPTYVYEGYLGADPRHQRRVRVVSEYAWHAAFAQALFVGRSMPSPSQKPDLTIYDFPSLGDTVGTYIGLDLAAGEVLITGTEYAGEIKKSAFTYANHIMPLEGILPMHCSANVGPDGDVTLFFGLSGTGKTTLSADERRRLIGDDEHYWHDTGIANLEGGCYAKVINLDPSSEPQIWKAIHSPGAILENVVVNGAGLDFSSQALTENTRGAYDLSLIDNAELNGWVETLPKNIIFLTCDAFGVLPPVSRLTTEQAGEHFLHGYTAKVAGTERGVTEPTATFSACFGEPFLVHPPQIYADLLMKKIQESGAKVWLVNTGWSGGPAGEADRMPIKTSRAIIDAIHNGSLDEADYKESIMGLQIPTSCPGLDDQSILNPRSTWEDQMAYDHKASALEAMFAENAQKLRRNTIR